MPNPVTSISRSIGNVFTTIVKSAMKVKAPKPPTLPPKPSTEQPSAAKQTAAQDTGKATTQPSTGSGGSGGGKTSYRAYVRELTPEEIAELQKKQEYEEALEKAQEEGITGYEYILTKKEREQQGKSIQPPVKRPPIPGEVRKETVMPAPSLIPQIPSMISAAPSDKIFEQTLGEKWLYKARKAPPESPMKLVYGAGAIAASFARGVTAPLRPSTYKGMYYFIKEFPYSVESAVYEARKEPVLFVTELAGQSVGFGALVKGGKVAAAKATTPRPLYLTEPVVTSYSVAREVPSQVVGTAPKMRTFIGRTFAEMTYGLHRPELYIDVPVNVRKFVTQKAELASKSRAVEISQLKIMTPEPIRYKPEMARVEVAMRQGKVPFETELIAKRTEITNLQEMMLGKGKKYYARTESYLPTKRGGYEIVSQTFARQVDKKVIGQFTSSYIRRVGYSRKGPGLAYGKPYYVSTTNLVKKVAAVSMPTVSLMRFKSVGVSVGKQSSMGADITDLIKPKFNVAVDLKRGKPVKPFKPFEIPKSNEKSQVNIQDGSVSLAKLKVQPTGTVQLGQVIAPNVQQVARLIFKQPSVKPKFKPKRKLAINTGVIIGITSRSPSVRITDKIERGTTSSTRNSVSNMIDNIIKSIDMSKQGVVPQEKLGTAIKESTDSRLKDVTSQVPPPLPTPPIPIPYIPPLPEPVIPHKLLLPIITPKPKHIFGLSAKKIKSIKVVKYIPSMKALLFGLKGKKPSGMAKTGLTFRPWLK